ncbi:hypothetical protein BH23THE1_BH23THE1_12770 [soil metagenome]
MVLLDIGINDNRANYIKWSVLWWKWLLSIPALENPLYDDLGINTNTNQYNSEVFFLCQTLESSGSTPKRHILVPKGKKLFLPVINWISFKDDDNQSDEELKEIAREKMDKVGQLNIFINNEPLNEDLTNYRIQSPIFKTFIECDNVLNARSGWTTLVSDGYWVCLDPLTDDLQISSFGSCSLGITEIGVNYQINLVNHNSYSEIYPRQSIN